MGDDVLFQLCLRTRLAASFEDRPQILERQALRFALFERQLIGVRNVRQQDLSRALIAPARGMDNEFLFFLRDVTAFLTDMDQISESGSLPLRLRLTSLHWYRTRFPISRR